jgi:hypothetical protein
MKNDLKLIAINSPYTLRGPREGRPLYPRAPAVARIPRTWHSTLALVIVSVIGAVAGCESPQPLPEAPPLIDVLALAGQSPETVESVLGPSTVRLR